MKRPLLLIPGILASVALCLPASAEQYVYPKKGQSASRQHKDEAACSRWATSKTGYDPAHPPVYPTAQAAPVTGSGARARGAAGGALIGAIGGNAGGGAAAGAVAGGLTRRVRNNRAANAQNEAGARQAAEGRANFERARASCLSGRGYTVR